MKAQNHELPRQGSRQGGTVSGNEDQRKHADTLPVDPRHPHGAKSGPRGRRARYREAGVSHCLPFIEFLLQQRWKELRQPAASAGMRKARSN